MYSQHYLRSALKQYDRLSQDELIDIDGAIQSLSGVNRTFALFVTQGYSLRAAGRLVGKPHHSEKRFRAICKRLSSNLGGAE